MPLQPIKEEYHVVQKTVLKSGIQIQNKKLTQVQLTYDVLYTHDKGNKHQLQKQGLSYPIQKTGCE